jgi:hypothetical protein
MNKNESTQNQSGRTQSTRTRKAALLLGALAIVGMGATTVACSPRADKPADTPAPPASVAPTEKAVRTNVTRAPDAAAPPVNAGGNAAVPCGFGPRGGQGCSNR